MVPDELIEKLRKIVGRERLKTSIEHRLAYSRDWAPMLASDAYIPDVVVKPKSTEEVAEIVKLANEYKVPVVPMAGLTGMGGGAVAVKGGIAIDTTGLNKILEVDTQNLTVTVQAGITIAKLNDELDKYGLWFPHDPESKRVSTIGAAIACDNDRVWR
ncbi:MAG: FAD-binding oxidoreductase [Candidatus Baldrarchaeia archaeon]